MGTPVKNLRYALELLLAGSVPNLELENLLLQLDEECAELDANSHLVVGHKLIIGQPVQEARLPYRRVPDDN